MRPAVRGGLAVWAFGAAGLLFGLAIGLAGLGPARELGHARAGAYEVWVERFSQGLGETVVDLGRPAAELPAILPGPADAWGQHRAHTVRLRFPLDHREALLLVLETRDTHDRLPPRLRVATEGWATETTTRPGTGRPPTEPGRSATYRIAVPASALGMGPVQEVRLTTVSGSWLAPACVRLLSARRAWGLGVYAERGALPGAVTVTLTLVLLSAGLGGLLAAVGRPERWAVATVGVAAGLAALHLAAPGPEVAWGLTAQERFPRWVHLLTTLGVGGAMALGAAWRGPSGWGTRPGIRFALVSLAAGPLFWLFRSYEDTPDAATWVRLAPDGVFFPREPLATWLQHLFWLGPGRLHGNPREALALLSCLAGVLALGCLLWLAWRLDRARGWVLAGLTASGYGTLQLFFGHVETYPLLTAALLGYLLLAVLALQGRLPLTVPALALGFMVALHLSAVLFAPSLLVLMIAAWRRGTLDSWGRWLGVAGAAALVPAATGLYLLVAVYDEQPARLVAAFREALGAGGGLIPLRELVSWAHLADLANEYALIAPVGLVLVLGVPLITRVRWGEDPAALVLAAAAAPYVLYSGLWRPGLGPYWDWDLFTSASAPLTLLGALLLVRTVQDPRALGFSAMVLIAVSLAHALPLIVAHTKSPHFVDVKRPEQPEVAIPTGLTLVDRLNVGVAADEAAHGYRVSGVVGRPAAKVGLADNPGVRSAGPALLWDGGVEHRGTEEFTVRVTPGRPVAIFKRIDAGAADQTVEVFAGDRPVGRWAIPGRKRGRYVTVRFDLPAGVATAPALRLRFTTLSADPAITSYYYWIYQPAPGG